MATTERVTVTLPLELVQGIDQFEHNRSRFVAEAVENELVRRKRQGLLNSLQNPHPDVAQLVDENLADWNATLTTGDDDLLSPSAGKSVRWIKYGHAIHKIAHRILSSRSAGMRGGRRRKGRTAWNAEGDGLVFRQIHKRGCP